MCDEGDAVRNAYLLNDTFELAKLGTATMSNRNVVKESLEKFFDRNSQVNLGTDIETATDRAMPRESKLGQIYEFFIEEMEAGGKQYYKAGDVARFMNVDPPTAGKLIQRAFPVSPERNKRYSAERILAHIEKWKRPQGRQTLQPPGNTVIVFIILTTSILPADNYPNYKRA